MKRWVASGESGGSKIERSWSGPHFDLNSLKLGNGRESSTRDFYRITRSFPPAEQFALTSQMRRAAISISSNIAEGAGRNSDRDFAHFLEQAYGSLMEVASQSFLALDEGYLSADEKELLLDVAQKLSAKLAALNRSLQVKVSKVIVPASGT